MPFGEFAGHDLADILLDYPGQAPDDPTVPSEIRRQAAAILEVFPLRAQP